MKEQTTVVEAATRRLKQKQELAKAGMTITLGLVTVTGFMRGRRARTIHVWSGFGLIGFTLWHYRLYQPDMLERELNSASQKKTSG